MLDFKTKFLIIEDHPIYLKGLNDFISKSFQNAEIEMALDGNSALEKINKKFFDIIFLDIELPDISGIEILKTLRKLKIKSKVIVNSYKCSQHQTMELLEIGVDGILLKDDKESNITEAINICNSNKRFFSKGIQNMIGKMHENGNNFNHLTDREVQVIRLICQGATISQMAEKLCITESTINNHKSLIFKKLEVKNSASLVKVASELGLI